MNDAANPWIGASTEHYENFPVGSLLLPAALRPAVAALYRFARYADDVADEGDARPEQRIAELARLRRAVLAGAQADVPVVAALVPFVSRHRLEPRLLTDLLSAFEQDVTVTRYEDFPSLLDYCRRSANPVGRLMLQLFEVRDDAATGWSDAICSALQLINFLQDVGIDWHKGRVYLPLQSLASAGLGAAAVGEAVAAGRCPAKLREVIRAEAERAGAMLESGRPLCAAVPRRLGLELRMIVAGGRAVLRQLADHGFDPVARRPKLGFADLPRILTDTARPVLRR